jgi:hypothetical protein
MNGSDSGSLAVNKNNTQKKKDALVGGFDPFETWLYNESTSSLTTHGVSGSFIAGQGTFALTPYPKRLINGQYVNHHTTGSLADNWYLSASNSATTFDEQNPHQLLKSIPQYIREDSNNSEYEIFVNMIGQHFDILWSYANSLTHVYKLEENPKFGIDKDILVDIAKSQGWQLTNGHQASALYRYALGTDKNGNFASTGSLFSAGDEALTGEVWRRIVNNLPYILKSRGTERGIRSLLNVYGIPQTLLSIREYGGPKVGNDWPVLTEDRYSYAIKFNSGSYLQWASQQIVTNRNDWGQPSLRGKSIAPMTREFRFRPFVTQSMILYSQIDVNGNPTTHIGIQHTGSMSGSAKYGRINLSFASGSGNSPMTASTDWVPLYNGDFWNLKYAWSTPGVHYNTGSNIDTTYRIDIQHASDFIKGKVSHTSSLSITPSSSMAWKTWADTQQSNTGSIVRLGGSTGSSDALNTTAYLRDLQGDCGTFSGSMQEYREWLEFLDEAAFDDHTLNPTSYVSSKQASSSYDTLVRQYTLGTETKGFDLSRNETIISSSHPIQSDTDFTGNFPFSTNATAYGFKEPSDNQRGNFVPVEETYYIRGASLGANNPRSQKIRLESNELIRRLSPTNTGEISSFDNAPLDSNKLGLFYSFADQVNKDIFNQTGRVELDDYVGDPDDQYSQIYNDLRYFSREYWKKFDNGSDVNVFNRIFSQFDFSIFNQIKQTLPERVDEATGLLIEPNILERSKVTVTKPIQRTEPFYDAVFESPKPTGSGDANIQYDAVIDNGETTVLTPSADKMDDLTGRAYSVRYTGSMRYCTIEVPPLDELASYTASFIESNFNRNNLSNPERVFESLYGNQTIPFNPYGGVSEYGNQYDRLNTWKNHALSMGKYEWQEKIVTGATGSQLTGRGYTIDAPNRRTFRPIRLITDNTYPHDVIVKPRIVINASQSYYGGYNAAIPSNTMNVDVAMYIPETENEADSRIMHYLDANTGTVDSASINNKTDVTIALKPVLVKAYTNPAFNIKVSSNAEELPASSSIEAVNCTGSFLMSGEQSDGDGSFTVGEEGVITDARAAWMGVFIRLDYFAPNTTGGDHFNTGSTSPGKMYLSASVDIFSNSTGTDLPYAPVRQFNSSNGALVLDDGFEISGNGDADSSTRVHFSNTTGSSLHGDGWEDFVTSSGASSTAGTTQVTANINKLQVKYELHEVCHRGAHEFIDDCRKSSIYDTLVFHYSGSSTIANKYDRDFDGAVSESKHLFYSRSLTPSCYRDDYFRYSIQHMSTLGTQLTAPSINAPSTNAALGNLPVIEIFEVNPNQIFYNKTPKQPSRGNRLDPGNLSIR